MDIWIGNKADGFTAKALWKEHKNTMLSVCYASEEVVNSLRSILVSEQWKWWIGKEQLFRSRAENSGLLNPNHKVLGHPLTSKLQWLSSFNIKIKYHLSLLPETLLGFTD